MRFRPWSRPLLLAAGILWAGAIALGLGKMLDHQFTPGAKGATARSWPTGSRLRPDPRRATLVMAVHPRCPCSRAGIEELARVLARARGAVTAHLLVYRPRQASPGWERADLWRSAAALPGVTVIADPEGREAARFGAVTSGHVLLYDRAGMLRFTGGITGSRGHAGENVGSDSVIALLTGGAAERPQTFVYGCPIQTEQRDSGK